MHGGRLPMKYTRACTFDIIGKRGTAYAGCKSFRYQWFRLDTSSNECFTSFARVSLYDTYVPSRCCWYNNAFNQFHTWFEVRINLHHSSTEGWRPAGIERIRSEQSTLFYIISTWRILTPHRDTLPGTSWVFAKLDGRWEVETHASPSSSTTSSNRMDTE